MKDFVVSTPLFDAEMAVSMYHLQYRSGNRMLGLQNDYQRMNDALTAPGLELVERFGIEVFATDKPLLVEATKFQILAGLPQDMDIDPNKLTFLISEDITNDADIINKCEQLKKAGYSFALSDYPMNPNNPVIPFLDYMVLDAQDPNYKKKNTWMLRGYKSIKPIIVNIPDRQSFKSLKSRPQAIFGGEFYSQPITEGSVVLSPLKINVLHLLYQVNRDDFDLLDIVRIIERDPYLTISLLKFINSRASGLNKKVESIKGAVTILGQKEVRRWATIALSVSLAEDRPSEITKLSLTRAKLAENLAGHFELGTFQSSLFLAGLFSMLDIILQQPMETAIKEICVNEHVARALVDHSGSLYPVLELIYAYERADWDKTSILMIKNNITIDDLSEAFVNAMVWYKQLLESIDEDALHPGKAPAPVN